MKFRKTLFPLVTAGAILFSLQATQLFAADTPPLPTGPQSDGPFRKVILEADRDVDGDGTIDNSLNDPMELSIAADGRVFYAQRRGAIRVLKPGAKTSQLVGELDVFSGLEDGLLGITLDPKFMENGWIYVYYSDPNTILDSHGKKAGDNIIARFTLKDDHLILNSEKQLLKVRTQREECCHAGGSLNFDSHGNLFLSTGDNTNPFASDGYAPIDERANRSPWDAQKSSANPNDLRGKILRIHPEPDGTYTIPEGNLFPPGTPQTRPEIYVMGNRNPYRISIDQKNGYLYWGEVGPDAGSANPDRGPAGYDEVNQARAAGFFGWPYFIGPNRAYNDFDFEKSASGAAYDPENPRNESPYNTGKTELPPAQPAFIYYAHFPSIQFPVVNSGGGRTAMAGPVYYADPARTSPHRLPDSYNHTLFIYEWSRNWVIEVKLDENDKIAEMKRFCPQMTFKRPMDMELGPDGCLYIIEWGTAWGDNLDTQIIRIEHHGN